MLFQRISYRFISACVAAPLLFGCEQSPQTASHSTTQSSAQQTIKDQAAVPDQLIFSEELTSQLNNWQLSYHEDQQLLTLTGSAKQSYQLHWPQEPEGLCLYQPPFQRADALPQAFLLGGDQIGYQYLLTTSAANNSEHRLRLTPSSWR